MNERLDHLDGLRGVAALIVVVFHLMSALTPWLTPAHSDGTAAWIAYTPLAVFWNGPFSVSVFFVLSGLVITQATLKKSEALWIDVTIRYLRLAVPAAVSVLLAWALLTAFPESATKLYALTGSPWLQYTYQAPVPKIPVAAYNGFVGIFLNGGSSFNNVLWTMRPEFIGSIACFLICLFKTARLRIAATIVFAIAVLLLQRFEYECFVLGIFLREALVARRLPSALPATALVAGLVLGSQSGNAAHVLGLDWLPSALTPANKGGLIYPVAAVLVVYGCIRSRVLVNALSGTIGRFLGSISFPLYLIHVPIIYTVLAEIFVSIYPSSALLFAVSVASILVFLVMAYAAEFYLEKPFLSALGGLRLRLRGARRLSPT